MDAFADRNRNGPSEFHVIGTLKTWDVRDKVHKIKVRTLLINGAYDEATDYVVQPYFDKIEKAKWVQFGQSSHMPHIEERDRFMEVVSQFLKA